MLIANQDAAFHTHGYTVVWMYGLQIRREENLNGIPQGHTFQNTIARLTPVLCGIHVSLCLLSRPYCLHLNGLKLSKKKDAFVLPLVASDSGIHVRCFKCVILLPMHRKQRFCSF